MELTNGVTNEDDFSTYPLIQRGQTYLMEAKETMARKEFDKAWLRMPSTRGFAYLASLDE